MMSNTEYGRERLKDLVEKEPRQGKEGAKEQNKKKQTDRNRE